jgi:hypothetical protein
MRATQTLSNFIFMKNNKSAVANSNKNIFNEHDLVVSELSCSSIHWSVVRFRRD